jgi:conjugative transfer signal peptidase TraF
MPEVLGFPGTRVGDELRRIIAARRLKHRRCKLLALIGIAAAPVAATALWKPPTLLVWNASASAPVGLYRIEPRAPVRRGDMLVAWAPQGARWLAASRHYLPANVPLVKRVAALEGDRVCAIGSAIRINGRRVATRLKRDSRARPMPWWSGCRSLGAGEYFLAGDSVRSFDGRYFGITKARDLVGRAVLLWARPGQDSHDG